MATNNMQEVGWFTDLFEFHEEDKKTMPKRLDSRPMKGDKIWIGNEFDRQFGPFLMEVHTCYWTTAGWLKIELIKPYPEAHNQTETEFKDWYLKRKKEVKS